MRIQSALFFVALLLGSPSLHAGLRLSSVELSPFRVLTLLDAGDVHSMAGGVYFRSTAGTRELAMPIAWYADTRTPAYDCCDTTVVRIDFQWRDFGSEDFSGQYHGPVFRLARVSGTEYQIDQFGQFDHGSEITFGRAGVGWVAGYRVPARRFSKNARFYWGVNISAGVYLDNARDLELRGAFIPHIETAIESQGQLWINLELLKLGFIF